MPSDLSFCALVIVIVIVWCNRIGTVFALMSSSIALTWYSGMNQNFWKHLYKVDISDGLLKHIFSSNVWPKMLFSSLDPMLTLYKMTKPQKPVPIWLHPTADDYDYYEHAKYRVSRPSDRGKENIFEIQNKLDLFFVFDALMHFNPY